MQPIETNAFFAQTPMNDFNRVRNTSETTSFPAKSRKCSDISTYMPTQTGFENHQRVQDQQ